MSRELLSTHGWRVTLEEAALPDGRMKEEVRIHRADSVHILALPTPGRILILREFRPLLGKHVWMLPSGKADSANDGSLLQAAQRELREETGFRAESLSRVRTCFYSDALSFRAHIFVAQQLVHDPLPQDDNESIEVFEVTYDEARKSVLSSDPVHALSGFALTTCLEEIHK